MWETWGFRWLILDGFFETLPVGRLVCLYGVMSLLYREKESHFILLGVLFKGVGVSGEFGWWGFYWLGVDVIWDCEGE